MAARLRGHKPLPQDDDDAESLHEQKIFQTARLIRENKPFLFADVLSPTYITVFTVSGFLLAGLFLYSHLEQLVYARLNIAIHFNTPGGGYSVDKKLLGYTIYQLAQDLWDGQAYFLAITVAYFSGFWPYIKILTMYFIVNFEMTHEARRGILIFVDIMGKYSFYDMFTVSFLVLSFYEKKIIDMDGFPVHAFLRLDLDTGILLFSFATTFSLIYIHVIKLKYDTVMGELRMASHRITITSMSDRGGSEAFYGKSQTFIGHGKRGLIYRYKPKDFTQKVIRTTMTIILVFGLVANTIGLTTDLVHFVYGGWMPKFLHFNNIDFTAVNIVTGLPAKTDQKFTAGFLSFLFAVLIFVVPYICLLSFLVLWLFPMHIHRQQQLMEILTSSAASWVGTDVLAFGLTAVAFLADQTAQYIFANGAPQTCGFIENHFHEDCLTIIGHLRSGMYWLYAVVVCFYSCLAYTIYLSVQMDKNYVVERFKTGTLDHDPEAVSSKLSKFVSTQTGTFVDERIAY